MGYEAYKISGSFLDCCVNLLDYDAVLVVHYLDSSRVTSFMEAALGGAVAEAVQLVCGGLAAKGLVQHYPDWTGDVQAKLKRSIGTVYGSSNPSRSGSIEHIGDGYFDSVMFCDLFFTRIGVAKDAYSSKSLSVEPL